MKENSTVPSSLYPSGPASSIGSSCVANDDLNLKLQDGSSVDQRTFCRKFSLTDVPVIEKEAFQILKDATEVIIRDSASDSGATVIQTAFRGYLSRKLNNIFFMQRTAGGPKLQRTHSDITMSDFGGDSMHSLGLNLNKAREERNFKNQYSRFNWLENKSDYDDEFAEDASSAAFENDLHKAEKKIIASISATIIQSLVRGFLCRKISLLYSRIAPPTSFIRASSLANTFCSVGDSTWDHDNQSLASFACDEGQINIDEIPHRPVLQHSSARVDHVHNSYFSNPNLQSTLLQNSFSDLPLVLPIRKSSSHSKQIRRDQATLGFSCSDSQLIGLDDNHDKKVNVWSSSSRRQSHGSFFLSSRDEPMKPPERQKSGQFPLI